MYAKLAIAYVGISTFTLTTAAVPWNQTESACPSLLQKFFHNFLVGAHTNPQPCRTPSTLHDSTAVYLELYREVTQVHSQYSRSGTFLSAPILMHSPNARLARSMTALLFPGSPPRASPISPPTLHGLLFSHTYVISLHPLNKLPSRCFFHFHSSLVNTCPPAKQRYPAPSKHIFTISLSRKSSVLSPLPSLRFSSLPFLQWHLPPISMTCSRTKLSVLLVVLSRQFLVSTVLLQHLPSQLLFISWGVPAVITLCRDSLPYTNAFVAVPAKA